MRAEKNNKSTNNQEKHKKWYKKQINITEEYLQS